MKNRVMRLSVLFASLLGLDALTKALTVHYVPLMPWASPYYPYGGLGIFKHFLGVDFSINYVANRGSAWGLFSEWQEWLLLVRIGAIIALFIYLIAYNPIRKRQVPLLLIIAGACGNVLDFFLYGHVVDMFHFNAWGFSCPVFNCADAAIFFGVLILMLPALKKRVEKTPSYESETTA